MESAVRKGTRLDYNPPKQKHISTLINLTFDNPGNAVYIVDLLEKRLRENSWIIIFKVLIIIHSLMIHGEGDKTMAYIETKPSALDTTKLREKSSGIVHIQNIYSYTAYLQQKVAAFRQSNVDYVKDTAGKKEGRLRHKSISQGLLKETVVLQKLIGTLLKCNFLLDDVDNNISLCAYRLLVEDLLILFQVLNEAIVNILEHYFTMSKPDARTCLEIYKKFAKQTEDAITFLERAKRLQRELNIAIPDVNHAPLSLASALQNYLNEETKSPAIKPSLPDHPSHQPRECIDFFSSLENGNTNTFYTPTVPIPSSPPIMTSATLPSFTGNNPFRQTTHLPSPGLTNANPFRASTMPPLHTGSNTHPILVQPPLSNNPFHHSNSQIPVASSPIQINSGLNPFTHTSHQVWGQSHTLF
ncbi:ANTH domain-containing protein [Sporodiniella umbellata]|nr:ANTH domain-containing protein [Sporodiniella umbellata]